MKHILNLLLVFAFICFYTSVSAQHINLIWAKATQNYSIGPSGRTVTIDAAGNVYTTGTFSGTVDFDPNIGVFNLTSTSSSDVFICKLDANGNFLWVKAMNGNISSSSQSYVITVDAVGNIYTTGNFGGAVDFDPNVGVFNLTGSGTFVSKLDTNGNFIWAKATVGQPFIMSVALDTMGNIYTTGTFGGTVDFDPNAGISNLTSIGIFDIFIFKLDANGNFVWAKGMNGTMGSNSYSLSIAVDINGNVYTTGGFRDTVDFNPNAGLALLSSVGDVDIFICKLDTNGDFAWVKTMGATRSDNGKGIAVDATGNIYTTGDFTNTVDFDPNAGVFNLTSTGSFNSLDIFVSKLDTNGNFIWAKSMGQLGADYGNAIALGANNNVYITGDFQGTVDFDPNAGVANVSSNGSLDIFVCKLDTNGNYLSAKGMGGLSIDEGTSVAVDATDNIYVSGYFRAIADFDPNVGVYNLTPTYFMTTFIAKYTQVPQCLINFTTITANDGTINTPYTLDASASNANNYIISPALPTGLNLNTSTGIISGTPTILAPSASYTVTASQSGTNCIKTQNYTFGIVSCVLFGLLPNTNFLPSGYVGVPYVGTKISVATPVGGFTYKFYKRNAINWQEGLTLNEDTGVIAGTPTFSTSIMVAIEAVSQTTLCTSFITTYTLVIYPDPTTSTDNILENVIKISPNPSNGDFNVDFGGINMTKSVVRVYDMQGRSVFSSDVNSNLMIISLDKCANGLYLLEIETSKTRIIKKLAKQ